MDPHQPLLQLLQEIEEGLFPNGTSDRSTNWFTKLKDECYETPQDLPTDSTEMKDLCARVGIPLRVAGLLCAALCSNTSNPNSVASLSGTEQEEVLHLMKEGLSAEDILAEMKIAVGTPKSAALELFRHKMLEDRRSNPKIKKHFKLLVIGKTGAGKTTFINMLINLAVGRRYKAQRMIAITQSFTLKDTKFKLDCNLDVFKEKQTDQAEDQSKSQTQRPNLYTVETDDFILTLVDTPGLGDTEGNAKDKEHIKNIVVSIQELTSINAIIYVHRATDLRKDIFLQYYINELKGMLTQECKDNFIVCLTSVVNPLSIEVEKCLKDVGIPTKRTIYFENDCLIPLDKLPFIDDEQREEIRKQSEVFWERNQKNCGKLIAFLNELVPFEASGLFDVLVKRQALVKIVCEKQRQMEANEKMKVQISQLQNSAQQERDKLAHYTPENLKEKVPVVKAIRRAVQRTREEEEDVGYHSTQCARCLFVCHDQCGMEVMQKGDVNFKKCAAFQGPNCQKCPQRCDTNFHFHSRKQMRRVAFTDYVEDTVTEWEDCINKDKEKIKEQLEKNATTLQASINQKKDQLSKMDDQIQSDLKQICFLHKNLKTLCMLDINDVTKDYLEKQIEAVTKNTQLSVEEAKRYETTYRKQLTSYLRYKQALEDASAHDVSQLTKAELDQIQNRTNQIQVSLINDFNVANGRQQAASKKEIKNKGKSWFGAWFDFW